MMETFPTRGYAAHGPKDALKPFSFQRRDPLPNDVQLDVLFCGVCHSDLHMARDEWGGTNYPCVPGHEIVGRVTKVGREVKRFKEGDLGAVGCLVDSCRDCSDCEEGLEQYCAGIVLTYNSKDEHTGEFTYGGYSKHIVVNEDFVLRVPANLDPAAAAPLLCAGITTYSPIRHWNVQSGQKVGVVGLGGLGHMALKFAHALGAHVVLFTHSPEKTADAKRLGADEVVISQDEDAISKHTKSLDFIIDTVSAKHDLGAYLNLLKRDGTMTLVGLPPDDTTLDSFPLIRYRRRLAGSLIGGIPETQEMLNFCSKHGFACDIEKIRMDQINEAYERMIKSDVRYRFVIDLATLD
jgi:uncharacterized zinc-type alcohol dehydrogenase-like protein